MRNVPILQTITNTKSTRVIILEELSSQHCSRHQSISTTSIPRYSIVNPSPPTTTTRSNRHSLKRPGVLSGQVKRGHQKKVACRINHACNPRYFFRCFPGFNMEIRLIAPQPTVKMGERNMRAITKFNFISK